MGDLCMNETRAVHPHDDVYGDYCTIEEFIDCDPKKVFEYLADVRSSKKWTWSTRFRRDWNARTAQGMGPTRR